MVALAMTLRMKLPDVPVAVGFLTELTDFHF
jgi:hypothetical protein